MFLCIVVRDTSLSGRENLLLYSVNKFLRLKMPKLRDLAWVLYMMEELIAWVLEFSPSELEYRFSLHKVVI
jgi:hypothetical protein